MKKRILFLLLITINTVIYGTQTPNSSILAEKALYTPDIISHITEHLCYGPDYQLKHVKDNIWRFSLTNKFFRNYFTQEKVQQNIIKLCSQYFNTNDSTTALHLRCRTIDKKINGLHWVACDKKQQFTELDLKDQWYLNATVPDSHYNRANLSLLCIAIENMNFKAAHKIIEHAQKLNFHYNRRENELHLIAHMRHSLQRPINGLLNTNKCKKLLTIAECLLQKNMLPDGRENDEEMTPLMQAISRKDEDLVRLLLQYGANPYIKYCPNGTIFEYLSETLDWLNKIINKQEKK